MEKSFEKVTNREMASFHTEQATLAIRSYVKKLGKEAMQTQMENALLNSTEGLIVSGTSV